MLNASEKKQLLFRAAHYRANQPPEILEHLKAWEARRAAGVHLHCLPASQFAVPPGLLPGYLEKCLEQMLLSGKRNFIFLEHNLKQPCVFMDAAFEILNRKKEEFPLRIWGVNYDTRIPRQLYPYDDFLALSRFPGTVGAYYHTISSTADTLLCDVNKAGHSAVWTVANMMGMEVCNLNQRFEEDISQDPGSVLVGDDPQARELYQRIIAFLPERKIALFHELLARIKRL